MFEGDAVRVSEPGAVARIAKAWADQGWPAEPDESGSGITRQPQPEHATGEPPVSTKSQDVANVLYQCVTRIGTSSVVMGGPYQRGAAQCVGRLRGTRRDIAAPCR